MKKLLVLEDEPAISEFVYINLNRAGYEVLTADTGLGALGKLAANPDTDIAILDVMLPDIDGFEVCKRIRADEKLKHMGVIMLTARVQEADRITGLMLGADDYVVKPFSPSELVLRVDALYRRIGGKSPEQSETLVSDDIELNKRSRVVTRGGEKVELTQVEFQILKNFLENPDKALSREEILDAVWGEDYVGELKVVDVNMRRLRIKIEADPASPRHIVTVWGYGYKWN